MASDNSKSISGSQSIPFTKSATDAFQDMTAFSPPSENWIIRYPKREDSAKKAGMKTPVVPEAQQLENPCRQYINGAEIPVSSKKSLGTDDHFKSAVCSKNLLNVCEKLLSSNTKKGFASHAEEDDDDFGELSLMNEKSRMEFYRSRHGNRRSSQSLPSSPKMERKNLPEELPVVSHNPYFTITKSEPRKESSISFLTSLFGITAAKPDEAKANLAQKYEMDSAASHAGNSDASAQQPRRMTPNPRASEYREMNIFSPTSM